MGGHGHHHGPPYTIPSPDIYKVESVPKLKKVQDKLAQKGLRDPWLRNEVWRYDKSYGTPMTRLCSFLFRGFGVGVAAFLITIAAEKALGIDYHGHHDEHHKDEHH